MAQQARLRTSEDLLGLFAVDFTAHSTAKPFILFYFILFYFILFYFFFCSMQDSTAWELRGQRPNDSGSSVLSWSVIQK